MRFAIARDTTAGGQGKIDVLTPFITNFDRVYEGLSRQPNDPFDWLRGVVSVSESPYRRRLHNLDFVAIPGLAFRLSCLAQARSEITWDQVDRSPQWASRVPGLRVLALEGEIGANYLEDTWGYVPNQDMQIIARPIDFKTVAKKFTEMLEEDVKSNGLLRTVLVCGEAWTYRIFLEATKSKDFAKKHGRELELVDISPHRADEFEPPVQKFRETIALNAVDKGWKTWLETAIRRTFTESTESMAAMAKIYATYFSKMVEEDQERVIDQLGRNQGIPSHLQLQRFEFIKVGDDFRNELDGAAKEASPSDT